MAIVSAGVLVTDGTRLLLGHATASPRWDIPKGIGEPGEAAEAAARRELDEETGLQPPVGALEPLGQHRYRPGKDLALFGWLRPDMPDPALLRCRSVFTLRGRELPEFDRFACPAWAELWPMVGKSLAPVLRRVAEARGWLPPSA